jgi:hypothetical protein
MNNEEKVKEFLKKRRVAEHVIKGGIKYLFDCWKKFVEDCEKNSYMEIEEYLNDLDGRDILQDVIEEFEKEDIMKWVVIEVKKYDERFRKLLFNTDVCAWGKPNEHKYISTKKTRFWYWGFIKRFSKH